MSYIFYNPNPDLKETGDCVIRAITKVLDMDWDTVFVDLFVKAFQEKDMMDKNYVWGSYLNDEGFVRHVIPDTCPECYTIRQFCIDHPDGKFIVATGSHVVAVIDGNYYDAWDSGARMRSRVTGRYISSHDSRDMGSSNNMYRDSYRDSYRDGYSGHDKMDLIKDLEMKMHNANSDRERESIRDTIEIIKRQN